MKSSMPIKRGLRPTLALLAPVVAFSLITAYAQQAPAAQKQTAETGTLNLTAKSANVSESGAPVRINLIRWSTDEERNSILASMNPASAAAGDRGGRGGRGGGARGGRGAVANADVVVDPADPDNPDNPDALPAGRGGAGRGGRGGARGARGDAAAPKPFDPIANLTAAIVKAPTLGYVWTNEVVGYAIKYAYRIPSPNGGERVIIATDRRLGGYTTAWKPATAAAPSDYEFTLIEIRLDSKGLGEGKTSLTAKVMSDSETKTLALDNYAAAPPMLQNIKR
jgi:hypothetical protein